VDACGFGRAADGPLEPLPEVEVEPELALIVDSPIELERPKRDGGLETGPAGMTIDAQSGLLHWTPPANAFGVQRVRIMAKDARGAFVTQDFELSISAPAKTS